VTSETNLSKRKGWPKFAKLTWVSCIETDEFLTLQKAGVPWVAQVSLVRPGYQSVAYSKQE
jgi:hypothetical protein